MYQQMTIQRYQHIICMYTRLAYGTLEVQKTSKNHHPKLMDHSPVLAASIFNTVMSGGYFNPGEITTRIHTNI